MLTGNPRLAAMAGAEVTMAGALPNAALAHEPTTLGSDGHAPTLVAGTEV